MLNDVRLALRALWRSPAFAIAAIGTLALGIGANTAMFSVADAVLLRPLPYSNSDRLVMVWDQLLKIGVHQLPLSAVTFDSYRADGRIFEAAAAFREDERNLTGSGGAERVSVISSTSGLLEMLGARASIGRIFHESDWRPDQNNVVVLSHALFARRFGADSSVMNQTLRLDDRAYRVIGVLRPEFAFSLRSEGADVWMPLPPIENRETWQFRMLARLHPGVGIAAAQSSVTAAAKHLEDTVHPYRGPNGEDPGYRATVVSLQTQLLGDFRKGTLILFSAVVLVLLIACVNVANLLLARAADRQREIAVRCALGASPIRLLRQWLAEAGVLALLAGAAGIIVAQWGVALLKALSPAKLPAIAQVGIDARALGFTLAISVVTCLLFGLAPAFSATGLGGRLRGPRRGHRASSALVATEVALALILLIGASLLLKSYGKLRQIDPGFRPDRLLAMRVQLSGPRYDEPRRRVEFFTEIEKRLAALPGVVSASSVSRLPVLGPVGSADGRGGNPFSIEGRAWNPNSAVPQIAHTQTVGVDYFRTMAVPLRSGRVFSGSDITGAQPVTVVNDTLARRFFPNGDAIGRRILLGAPRPGASWLTIVGIVGDVKTASLDQPEMPQFYTALAQDASRSMAIVLRTADDPILMAREAAAVVRTLDPDQPVSDVRTMEARIADSVGQPLFQTTLLGLFAASALLLAAVGLYGVVTYTTIQRTREMGIRVALGADPRRVITAVLSPSLRPVALGIVVGLAGAAALGQFFKTVLFEVPPLDAVSFIASGALLALVAVAACLLPARRAARQDPLVALRHD